MFLNNFEVEVLVNGKPVRTYIHEGRYYIEGRKGTEFKIKIKNNSGRRIVAVPTVDGISVIDGNAGSYDSPGYVIGPHNTTVIEGWRVSEKDVSTFYFCDKEESYATKVSEGGNQGIIGVVIFMEKENYYKWEYTPAYNGSGPLRIPMPEITNKVYHNGEMRNYSEGCNATMGDTHTLTSASLDLGTGWGDKKESWSSLVIFERESPPVAVFEIYYASREKLERRGIRLNASTPHYITAFPGQFCKPPGR